MNTRGIDGPAPEMGDIADPLQLVGQRYPIPAGGERVIHPVAIRNRMRAARLTGDLYPLAAGRYPIARGHRVLRRIETPPLIYYCTAGRAELLMNDIRHRVTSGDLVVIKPHAPHSYAADPHVPWTVHWLYVDGASSADYVAAFGDDPVVHIGVDGHLVAEMDFQVEWRRRGYSDLSLVEASCRLKAVIAQFAAMTERRGCLQINGPEDIGRARELMLSNLDRPLRIEDYARAAGLSPCHFIRKFHASTGYSPLRYHVLLRMQKACSLLDATLLPVGQIASQVGFSDPYHFSRVFRRTIGMSPRQYRNSGPG